jgi:hypothetical protein
MNVISLVDAQVAPPCADKVLPCMDYLNSTNPPDICCNPIKDVFDATQEACFCQLATPGLLEGFGVKLSEALTVLHACGVNFDVNSCKGMYILYVKLIKHFIFIIGFFVLKFYFVFLENCSFFSSSFSIFVATTPR